MEKKVSYLMLVLCLFLFPFRVRGLEVDEYEPKEEIAENIIDENIQENLEDLVKIEDPQEVLREVTPSNEEENDLDTNPDEENQEENKQDVEGQDEQTPGDNETPGEGENIEEGNQEEPGENNTPSEGEEPVVQKTELSEFNITGVITELIAGENFNFGGTSGEPDKYSVVREAWNYYNYQEYTSSTSDENYNNELGEDYAPTPTADRYYDYELTLRLEEDYEAAEEVTVIINGKSYEAVNLGYTLDESIVCLDVSLLIQSKNPNDVYVDQVEITGAELDAYVDQTPLYGASSNTDHFTVSGEAWILEEQVDDDYYSYINSSDKELMNWYETTFDKFEAEKEYMYYVIIDAEAGYHLLETAESGYENYYTITINGEEKKCTGYFDYLEDGSLRYYLCALSTTPTEVEEYEVTENADPVVTEGEIEDVSMTVDSEDEELEAVYVDEELISEENYTTEGNTILTLLANFLNTLGQGIHNIAMKFSNGNMAYTTITIEAGEQAEEEPAATQTSGTNTSEVAADYVVQNVVSEEKPVDNKLEVKEKEEEKIAEEEEEKEESNIGLIIFLILLILIAIIIPITIYRKNN